MVGNSDGISQFAIETRRTIRYQPHSEIQIFSKNLENNKDTLYQSPTYVSKKNPENYRPISLF